MAIVVAGPLRNVAAAFMVTALALAGCTSNTNRRVTDGSSDGHGEAGGGGRDGAGTVSETSALGGRDGETDRVLDTAIAAIDVARVVDGGVDQMMAPDAGIDGRMDVDANAFDGGVDTAPLDLPAALLDGGSADVPIIATGGSGAGGRSGAGGVTGTGGSTMLGGATGTGGAMSTGGTPGTGGATSTGGTPGTGGATNTGGTPGTGGTTSTGGTPGAGGTTSTCSPVYDGGNGTCEVRYGYPDITTPGDAGYVVGDHLLGEPINITSAITVSKLAVNVVHVGTDKHVVMALYQDASGVPGGLVAWTPATTLVEGRNEIPVNTPVAIAAGTYWLMAVYDTTPQIATDTALDNRIVYILFTFSADVPSAFPGGYGYWQQHLGYYVIGEQ